MKQFKPYRECIWILVIGYIIIYGWFYVEVMNLIKQH